MHRDLLEGLLPAGNPLVPFDPQELNSTFISGPRVEIQVVGEAPLAIPEVEVAQLVLPKKIARKRRRSWVGPIMTLLVLGMFAGLAVCVWLLVNGTGLTTSGQLVAAKPTSVDNPGNVRPIPNRPVEAPPRANAGNDRVKNDRLNIDPVMGVGRDPMKVEPDVEQPPASLPPADTPIEMAPVEEVPAMEETPMEETPMEVPAEEPVVGGEMESETDDGQFELALEAVANQFRSGDFTATEPLMELAQAQATTPEERQRLNGFALLPELLEHYREGIARGAESLGAGKTIDLVPGLTINVVESSRQKFVFKVEGRVKRYELDKAPLVVLHRLAEIGLPPDDNVAQASKAVFQAFWPSATLAHRLQSLEWLRAIQSTDEFEPEMLVAALQHIFELPETITTE